MIEEKNKNEKQNKQDNSTQPIGLVSFLYTSCVEPNNKTGTSQRSNMPTYSARCSNADCCHEQDYFRKVADRNDTPACDACGSPTERTLDAPMVTAMGLSDAYQVRSPIDGKMLYGRDAYYAHMKQHNVVPLSDLQGEAEHQKKAQAIQQKEERRKTIERVVRDKL